MKRVLLIIFLLVVIQLTSNSIFSPQGYPISSSGNDIYGEGMGGTGLADLYRINGNSENPSLMVTSNNVSLSTAVNMGYYWYDDSVDRFRDDGLSLPYFTITLPLLNHRFGISLRSMYSGNLDTGGSSYIMAGADTLDYSEINRKRGNIYRLGMKYAYKNPYVNVGVSLLYYLGNDIHFWSLDFDDSEYQDSKYELEKRFSGMSWNIGLSRRFGNIALGISYEPSMKMDGNSYYRYDFDPGTDVISSDKELYELPSGIQGGVTFLPVNIWKLSGDFRYRFYEDTETGYVNSFTGEEERYHDSWRFGFGTSYEPLAGYGRWYESIPFRAGVSYERKPFKQYDENTGELHEVNELSFSFGSSLQLHSPGRKLDFCCRYTMRNSEIESNDKDESLEFGIGLTGIDIFKKIHRRTEEREIPKVDPGMGVREDTQ